MQAIRAAVVADTAPVCSIHADGRISGEYGEYGEESRARVRGGRGRSRGNAHVLLRAQVLMSARRLLSARKVLAELRFTLGLGVPLDGPGIYRSCGGVLAGRHMYDDKVAVFPGGVGRTGREVTAGNVQQRINPRVGRHRLLQVASHVTGPCRRTLLAIAHTRGGGVARICST
ncbi:MAG: hypothetical protein ACK5MR_13750 [Cumulibacter sp.]